MERKTQNDDMKLPVFPHTQRLRGKKKKREEKKLPMGAGRRGGKLLGYHTLLRGNIKDASKTQMGSDSWLFLTMASIVSRLTALSN